MVMTFNLLSAPDFLLLSGEGSPWVTSSWATNGMFSGQDAADSFFFDDIAAMHSDLFELEMHFDLEVLWLISVFSIGWTHECRKRVNMTKNKRTHLCKLLSSCEVEISFELYALKQDQDFLICYLIKILILLYIHLLPIICN